MRISVFIRTSLLMMAAVWPALALAQFQQPTKEELKMTADPKAPGASAVFLYFEETTDDPLHYHSLYVRIKVLEEKGKELATVELPYQRGDYKITDIKARTIHADGTVVPLEGKPEDLLTSKNKDKQVGRMVFTLPSVEVGSILEYRYQLRYDDHHYSSPFWELQHEYFVHKAHYAFTPFKAFMKGTQNQTSMYLTDAHGNTVNSLLWWPQLPPGVEVKTDFVGRFSLDLEDIPAIPHEEWMPPVRSFLYHVLFYYVSGFNAAEFWQSEEKRWSKEVDHFAEPSKPIKEAVNGLLMPDDSAMDKARKLYKAVQALDNTDYSRKKGQAELKQLGLKEAKRAEDTWAQKSGSSEDIALLYLAMARAAGLNANAMRVVNRNQGIFAPAYLRFDQLDDDIILMTIDGKEIALDPGEKMAPFQTLKWIHSGAGGVRQGVEAKGYAFAPMSPYTANTLLRIGDVTLDDKGTMTGDFRFVMTGQEALFWRQAALENDEDEVKKRFDRWLETLAPAGVDAHIDHFLALDQPESNLIAIVKASGTLGTATAKRVLLPGFFFETHSRMPFIDREKRQVPVDMHYPEQVTDQVTYHLPAGLKVEGAPESAKIPWADRAVLVIKTVTDAGKVTIARQFSRGFAGLKAEDYPALREFYQKVATADQQQLVLTAAEGTGK